MENKTKPYQQLAQEIIHLLAAKSGVSGYEHGLLPVLKQCLNPFVEEIYSDLMGSCYAVKKGHGSNQTVMLAAHSDEIGLIITHIDSRGFLHFAPIGGLDERTLLYQEVTVHGREDLPGIISFLSDPTDEKKRKSVKLANMAIDIGYPVGKSQELISPGDIVSKIGRAHV